MNWHGFQPSVPSVLVAVFVFAGIRLRSISQNYRFSSMSLDLDYKFTYYYGIGPICVIELNSPSIDYYHGTYVIPYVASSKGKVIKEFTTIYVHKEVYRK